VVISNTTTPGTDKRPIDIYFDQYTATHQNPTNKLINWVCVPLIIFSLLGLFWAIPFPYIKFLGQYNGYFNWASFLIAGAIYYYYKLSPVLSYLMLLLLFSCSYGIMELDTLQKTGGPALWQVSLVLFAASWIGQLIGYKIEGKRPSFTDELNFLLIGPIWLLSFLLKRFLIKY
jgi:uncharacterized membrane protein YGL010W